MSSVSRSICSQVMWLGESYFAYGLFKELARERERKKERKETKNILYPWIDDTCAKKQKVHFLHHFPLENDLVETAHI